MLGWLQDWYTAQCDGDWEHGYGIHIDTLDNPGWRLSIALEGTSLEGTSLSRVVRQNPTDENDWAHFWIEKELFQGRGGPRNLQELLQAFRDVVESQSQEAPDKP